MAWPFNVEPREEPPARVAPSLGRVFKRIHINQNLERKLGIDDVPLRLRLPENTPDAHAQRRAKFTATPRRSL